MDGQLGFRAHVIVTGNPLPGTDEDLPSQCPRRGQLTRKIGWRAREN